VVADEPVVAAAIASLSDVERDALHGSFELASEIGIVTLDLANERNERTNERQDDEVDSQHGEAPCSDPSTLRGRAPSARRAQESSRLRALLAPRAAARRPATKPHVRRLQRPSGADRARRARLGLDELRARRDHDESPEQTPTPYTPPQLSLRIVACRSFAIPRGMQLLPSRSRSPCTLPCADSHCLTLAMSSCVQPRISCRIRSICLGLTFVFGRSNWATNRLRNAATAARGIGSRALGSRCHSIVTTCQGRFAKGLGSLRDAWPLRRLVGAAGADGVGEF
jgi:hypothetical protein